MKKYRYILFLSVLMLLCCSLFGCVKTDRIENITADNNYQQDNTEPASQNVLLSDQKISLLEMESTGEIPYNMFLRNCGSGVFVSDTDLFPFKYNSKYGYADANGNVIISDKYDEASMFSEGKALVEQNGRWMIIDTQGEELYTIPEEFSDAADYLEDTPMLFRNGKTILANKTTITHPDKGYGIGEDILNVLVIYDDLQTEKFEIVTEENLDYKIINTPEFCGFITFNLDRTVSEDGNYIDSRIYRLLDLSGNEIWKSHPDTQRRIIGKEYYIAMGLTLTSDSNARLNNELDILTVNDGYMNVFDENLKWGLLNVKTGEVEIEYKYDYIGAYSNGLCNICSYGKWGYIDLKGNEVVAPKYKYTESFSNNAALIINEDGYISTVDTKGNLISETSKNLSKPAFQKHNIIYSNIGKYSLSVIYNEGNNYMVVSNKGEILLERSFNSMEVLAITDNYIFVDFQMYKIEK